MRVYIFVVALCVVYVFWASIYIYVNMYMYVYVCMYVCMYVSMYGTTVLFGQSLDLTSLGQP